MRRKSARGEKRRDCRTRSGKTSASEKKDREDSRKKRKLDRAEENIKAGLEISLK